MSSKQEIEKAVRQLNERAELIAEELLSVAAKLKQERTMYDSSLVRSLESFRLEFDRVRELLLKFASESKVDLPDLRSETPTIRTLLENLGEIESRARVAAEFEALKHKGMEILSQILLVSHLEQIEFPALDGFREQAKNLLQAFTEASASGEVGSFAALQGRLQPFLALRRMLDDVPPVTDGEVELLFEELTRHFGQPFALAVVRRKLHFAFPVPNQDSRPVDGTLQNSPHEPVLRTVGLEEVPAPQDVHDEQGKSDSSQPREAKPNSAESDTASTGILKEGHAGAATGARGRSQTGRLALDAQKSTPPTAAPNDSIYVKIPADMGSSDMARIALDCGDQSLPDPSIVQGLIWQLLAEGAPDFAFHLARCLDEVFPA